MIQKRARYCSGCNRLLKPDGGRVKGWHFRVNGKDLCGLCFFDKLKIPVLKKDASR